VGDNVNTSLDIHVRMNVGIGADVHVDAGCGCGHGQSVCRPDVRMSKQVVGENAEWERVQSWSSRQGKHEGGDATHAVHLYSCT
jgi:hypothetical protein